MEGNLGKNNVTKIQEWREKIHVNLKFPFGAIIFQTVQINA